jgi:methylmalonyl-CoA mutase N-terminal domain/subunit
MREIDGMGGMLPAIERGYPQAWIAQASYEYQQRIERGEQVIVGVNAFEQADDHAIDLLQLDERPSEEQKEKLVMLRSTRDGEKVRSALGEVRRAASSEHENTMPYILEAVRASATLGEICEALRDVYGGYQENSIL